MHIPAALATVGKIGWCVGARRVGASLTLEMIGPGRQKKHRLLTTTAAKTIGWAAVGLRPSLTGTSGDRWGGRKHCSRQVAAFSVGLVLDDEYTIHCDTLYKSYHLNLTSLHYHTFVANYIC